MHVNYFKSRVKGITFRRACYNINDYHNGMFLKLEIEDNNPYDVNAIKIIDSFGNHIGYVGREVNSIVRRIILSNRYYCKITNVYDSFSNPSIEFTITYECFNGEHYDNNFEKDYRDYSYNNSKDDFGPKEYEKRDENDEQSIIVFSSKEYECVEDDITEKMINEAVDLFWSFYYERAYSTFAFLASKNNLVAEFFCGIYYLEGYVYAINYELAFSYFKRAYEHGHKYACFYIGWMYENGFFVEKNVEIATKYYDKAAEMGINEARYRLAAIAYFEGENNKYYSNIEEEIKNIVDTYMGE